MKQVSPSCLLVGHASRHEEAHSITLMLDDLSAMRAAGQKVILVDDSNHAATLTCCCAGRAGYTAAGNIGGRRCALGECCSFWVQRAC
jgi:hypothetical protein